MFTSLHRTVMIGIAASALAVTASAFDQSDIDGASAGDTLTVTCAGSPHVQSADLDVDKTLTIVGESGCATSTGKPVIEFSGTGAECHEVNILADDVTLDNIHFVKTTTSGCATQAFDSYTIVMPSSFASPVSTVPYGRLTVSKSVFEGSRRAMRINSDGDTTIIGNEFSGNARDVLFVANLRSAGVLTIEDNFVNGWGRKFVLVESGPSTDRVTGTINITGNVADGLLTSPNFFVYNHWEGSPTESASWPVALSVVGNDIRNLSSNAVVWFFPVDFEKLTSIEVFGNLIFDAGRGVIVDYFGADSIAEDGQILVDNNVFCDVDKGKSGSFISVGSQNNAIGYKDPPPGATLNAFGPGPPPATTAAANTDGEAPGERCVLPPLVSPEDVVDHFQCYEIKHPRPPRDAASASSGPTSANLVDQFAIADVRVGEPVEICVPVDKNGEGILHPTAHLVCYELPKGERVEKEVLISNQFGELVFEVEERTRLCVPSTKEVLEPEEEP